MFLIVCQVVFGNTLVFGQEKKAETPERLGFKLPEGRSSYTVPFELIDNLIVVKIVMNRTLPLKFIIDTGVRTSILTEKTFTDLLNVNYSRVIRIPVPGS